MVFWKSQACSRSICAPTSHLSSTQGCPARISFFPTCALDIHCLNIQGQQNRVAGTGKHVWVPGLLSCLCPRVPECLTHIVWSFLLPFPQPGMIQVISWEFSNTVMPKGTTENQPSVVSSLTNSSKGRHGPNLSAFPFLAHSALTEDGQIYDLTRETFWAASQQWFSGFIGPWQPAWYTDTYNSTHNYESPGLTSLCFAHCSLVPLHLKKATEKILSSFSVCL